MKFLYCKICQEVYFVSEVNETVAARASLEGIEFVVFTEGSESRREFCRNFHSCACETLEVVNSYIIEGAEEDPLKTLVFIVVNSEGVPAIVVKKRRSITEPPTYKLYGKDGLLPIPSALLSA